MEVHLAVVEIFKSAPIGRPNTLLKWLKVIKHRLAKCWQINSTEIFNTCSIWLTYLKSVKTVEHKIKIDNMTAPQA